METSTANLAREPWNKGKLVGQKTPFKLNEIWAIRIRLQIASRCRDLALFNLAVDSKLRACDLMQLRVRDVCHGQSMASRALILQQKTSRPVQFEITEPARAAVSAWISHSNLKAEDFLFPSRIHASPHLSTRQYARIVDSWVIQLGLDPANYGTHTLRRTKATLIYRRTKNLRAVQLLLGHTKLESTIPNRRKAVVNNYIGPGSAKTRSSIPHNGFHIAAVRRTSYQSRYCLNCSGNLKARLAPVYWTSGITYESNQNTYSVPSGEINLVPEWRLDVV